MSTTDISSCADEPIRTPGAIQPHGILLRLNRSQLLVEVVSENVTDVLGINVSDCLGATLSDIFSARTEETVRGLIESLLDGEEEAAAEIAVNAKGGEVVFDCRICLTADFVLIELDNLRTTDIHAETPKIDILVVQRILSRLGRQKTVSELAQAVVREVRKVTGFDRIMVYRFHTDYHGEVIAESVVDGWESYLGLHFPESDIPKQARALYCENPVRFIATSSYQAVGLCAGALQSDAIDLSSSQLRSVSPIHLEYLQNMGVGSSMSISLMDGDSLWGLIACHHKTSKYFDYRSRKACELLGTTFSLMLLQLEEAEYSRELIRLQHIERKLIAFMANTVPFIDGAFRYLPNLSDLVNADGAASITGDHISGLGFRPGDTHINNFVDWLVENDSSDVFATHCLVEHFPDAEQWENELRGVLVIEISRARRQFLLCFRRQVVQTVTWGGNPDKNVTKATKQQRLRPRESFSAWVEEVTDKSQEWSTMEISVAHTLRRTILHVIVDWTKEVAGLNEKLRRSNKNLQTFAETAAHDLKEPLRGIGNFISFFQEDHAAELNEEMLRKFSVIDSLARRGHELTNALLTFSEVGANSTIRKLQLLDPLLDAALFAIDHMISQSDVEVRRLSPLPAAWVDATLITQVFQNLLSNAIKYSTQNDPWVEIGALNTLPDDCGDFASYLYKPGDTLLYVKDNGIGISDEHVGEIFKLFKRVHPRSAFGGGNGIGLSIAQRIVEHHGGHLWVSSIPDVGSTFYFILSGEPVSSKLLESDV